jgi:hypothetical protein
MPNGRHAEPPRITEKSKEYFAEILQFSPAHLHVDNNLDAKITLRIQAIINATPRIAGHQ